MKVKRYKQIVGGLQENTEGDYVDYSDYQKLVAENAALKGLIEMHAGGFAVCPNCSHEEPSETDDIVALYRSTETPATDAAIADIKAQGADTVAEHHRVRADALCDVDTKGMYRHQLAYLDANDVAANLRAGRN